MTPRLPLDTSASVRERGKRKRTERKALPKEKINLWTAGVCSVVTMCGADSRRHDVTHADKGYPPDALLHTCCTALNDSTIWHPRHNTHIYKIKDAHRGTQHGSDDPAAHTGTGPDNSAGCRIAHTCTILPHPVVPSNDVTQQVVVVGETAVGKSVKRSPSHPTAHPSRRRMSSRAPKIPQTNRASATRQ